MDTNQLMAQIGGVMGLILGLNIFKMVLYSARFSRTAISYTKKYKLYEKYILILHVFI